MTEEHFFVLLLAMYGGVVAAGGWAVMHSERRRLWRGRLAAALGILSIRAELLVRNVFASASQAFSRLRSAVQSAVQAIRRRKSVALGTLAMLLLPPLLALFFSMHSTLEGYADTPEPSATVVAALLRGEQLVPPPPLPPEIFLNVEPGSGRPEIASASREWALLDSEFRQRLLTVYRLMAGHGYPMALLEGYRSPERQAQLARLGPQVTHAGAYQSFHQYGLAADSAFLRDGKLVISEKDAWAMEGYRLYGKYAESVGLVWGGRWQLMDFGHVELRKPGMLGQRQGNYYQ